MREILFKGWRKNNRGWVCGSLVKKISGAYIISEDITGCIADYTEHEIDPETVCQYTGLTDKNGRKIFEGDIVRNFICVDDHGDKLYDIGVVRYDEETFGFSAFDEENGRYNLRFMGNIEVIGNIFDNPELIGDQP